MRKSPYAILRNYLWEQQAICFAPLIIVLAFLGMDTGDNITLYYTALRENMPNMTRAMTFLTDWPLYCLYAFYAVLLLRAVITGERTELRWIMTFVLVQVCITVFLVQFVKTAVGRPRPLPALAGAEFAPWVLNNDNHSFPSGHAAEVTGAASPLAVRFRCPALSFFLGLIIALVSFSRIYLSRHHLSDVAGGACIGLAASVLNFYLMHRESS